jgi:hypothetical protein
VIDYYILYIAEITPIDAKSQQSMILWPCDTLRAQGGEVHETR